MSATRTARVIVYVEELQALRCEGCGEMRELRRDELRDQEALFFTKEELEEKHKDCMRFREDPALAKAARCFRVGMRAEMRKAGLR